jgi:lipopolysaccharide transport system permease protein
VIIITNEDEGVWKYAQRVWHHRSLIRVFAERDLKVKYAHTVLGLIWSVLQPLTAVVIFTFFFGFILGWESHGLPYAIYVLSGLLAWNFFSYIVFQGTTAVQESEEIIKRIYFPKVILPLSKVAVAAVELGISFLLLIPIVLWYGQPLSWHIVLLPIVILINCLMGIFVVFISSSMAYRMRDLLHVVPFLMYFGIWCTPVFFTKDILPEAFAFLWYFNPMASVVELWRWCLFAGWSYDLWFIPALLAPIPLSIIGFLVFVKSESNFSDYA